MPEPINVEQERTPRARRRSPRTEAREEGRQTAAAEVKPKTRSSADKKLAASIAGIYQMAGVSVTGIGLRFGDEGLAGSGVQMVNIAEPISDAWLDLADQNPRVKKALVKFTEASAATVVIGLHLTVLVPILIARGVVPVEFAAAFMDVEQAAQHQNGNGDATHQD